MKRKLSICILSVILLFMVGILTFFPKDQIKNNETTLTEQKIVHNPSDTKQATSEKTVQTNGELQDFPYVMFMSGDRLIVYRTDLKTVFMETDILVDQLPMEVQKKLTSGMGFSSEMDVYDFLESYSS